MAEVTGRVRERESTFPMIPVDKAIGDVLREAVPLEAITMQLSNIPRGTRSCAIRVVCNYFVCWLPI